MNSTCIMEGDEIYENKDEDKTIKRKTNEREIYC